jgi:hypothetical protein
MNLTDFRSNNGLREDVSQEGKGVSSAGNFCNCSLAEVHQLLRTAMWLFTGSSRCHAQVEVYTYCTAT